MGAATQKQPQSSIHWMQGKELHSDHLVLSYPTHPRPNPSNRRSSVDQHDLRQGNTAVTNSFECARCLNKFDTGPLYFVTFHRFLLRWKSGCKSDCRNTPGTNRPLLQRAGGGHRHTLSESEPNLRSGPLPGGTDAEDQRSTVPPYSCARIFALKAGSEYAPYLSSGLSSKTMK